MGKIWWIIVIIMILIIIISLSLFYIVYKNKKEINKEKYSDNTQINNEEAKINENFSKCVDKILIPEIDKSLYIKEPQDLRFMYPYIVWIYNKSIYYCDINNCKNPGIYYLGDFYTITKLFLLDDNKIILKSK